MHTINARQTRWERSGVWHEWMNLQTRSWPKQEMKFIKINDSEVSVRK